MNLTRIPVFTVPELEQVERANVIRFHPKPGAGGFQSGFPRLGLQLAAGADILRDLEKRSEECGGSGFGTGFGGG